MRLIEYGVDHFKMYQVDATKLFSNLLNPEWHFVFWREKFARRDYAELFSRLIFAQI